MNRFAILEDKLRFLHNFCHQSTEPFLETKRKIEVGEEPFIDRRNPEDYDEPPFLSEWQDADQGLKLQRQVCLTLLQRSFREYLSTTIRDYGGEPEKLDREARKEQITWFDKYRRWFLSELKINWNEAPVPLNRIEELSVARNCVEHGGEKDGSLGDVLDSHSLLKRQSLKYHERFPDAFFADEFERQLWKECNDRQPVTIDLSPDKLDVAIHDIMAFCGFIQGNLPYIS